MELCVPPEQGLFRRRSRRRRRRGLPPYRDWRRARWGRAAAGAIVVCGLGAAVAAPAEVFTSGEELGILQQSFGWRNSPGVDVGSLVVKPSVDLAGSFDSNVFAAPAHERSDVLASLRPAIVVESAWPRDAFSLRAEGDFRRYATFSREDNDNASVTGTGRIDLAGNAYLLAGAGYQLLHEDRGALVPVNGIRPTQFTVASGKTGIVIEPAPLGLRLDATVDSYAYDNVQLFNGAIAGETARDRVVYALEPRISYQVAPQYNAFLRAVVNRRQYNSTREPDQLDRSSTGFAADLGAALDLPGFAAGEFYIGYIRQNYDTHMARSIGTIDFGAGLEWRPAAATALRFSLARSVEESAVLGSVGNLQTAVRLGVEHALRPRIEVLGSLGYVNADFAGPAGSSDLYELRVGGRYLVAENLTAGLEYDLGYRASSAALPHYTRHIVELRLRGEL